MLRGFEKLLVLYLRRLPSRPDGVPNAGEADVFFQGGIPTISLLNATSY
jgi:hypothetical protein